MRARDKIALKISLQLYLCHRHTMWPILPVLHFRQRCTMTSLNWLMRSSVIRGRHSQPTLLCLRQQSSPHGHIIVIIVTISHSPVSVNRVRSLVVKDVIHPSLPVDSHYGACCLTSCCTVWVKKICLRFSDIFLKRLAIFNQFLHTYYTILSTLDYKFLFNYI